MPRCNVRCAVGYPTVLPSYWMKGDGDVDVVSVAIIEDQPLVRAGYRDVLTNTPDIEIAYSGVSYRDVLTLEATVDLVLLDLYPGDPLSGGQPDFAALGALTPSHKVLVISGHARDEDVFDVTQHFPVVGYLTKEATGEEVREAVRKAAAGETVMSPELAGVLLNETRRRRNAPRLPPAHRRMLELIADGCTNRQIAEILSLSPMTVPKEVTRIRQALGATSREESRVWLAKRAEELGLVGETARRRRFFKHRP